MAEFIHKGDEKKKYVQQMFDDISPKYDFLNHLLSFGIDYYWRWQLVRKLKLKKNGIVLDVATGTGDVGFAILKKHPVKVIGLDYAFKMTEIARQKAEKQKLKNITFLQGDGENLPFANETFDALTIAYGFRNIGHYDDALNEFYRVLKPNGQLAILEFSQPNSVLFGKFYQFYFSKVLPKVASIFARNDAYRYLPESVAHFPKREEIAHKMIHTGFQRAEIIDLTFGMTTIFIGEK
ncbi:MAG: bifunctional demethylmenaquinone methyltransferase/2-methoxy-6-polyprenyl-1,4-benzoquinol methylase UbiE [Candidatus Marinimicrobia bacterium]|nr:bifunctional demethylmenaquinone methyltransferase/2-methoxy-6-polyprenyl-1,4-benzoquinol methylase UbiE [Candidatus Neomarinimicrobiota bacterium]MBL7022844.1 bifunctional demethylmenaquinone methyltransferase/2-methoxy-6-polyprenyl-1,4-benzoquinol methylase UbiE [Candidatus Neomarinimicrobiota bacterium]MBL7109435.1 bifunctional demethylmenaquinone methyltransferase/2-methoxy-6-polyprenyl-1,4-benzoquinol methylase UbiE [Candidatus Neomarinimicrobiota bacterium]